MLRQMLTHLLANALKYSSRKGLPTVEAIQDLVEEVLLMSPYKKSAKAYILYRDQHSRIRELVNKAKGALAA